MKKLNVNLLSRFSNVYSAKRCLSVLLSASLLATQSFAQMDEAISEDKINQEIEQELANMNAPVVQPKKSSATSKTTTKTTVVTTKSVGAPATKAASSSQQSMRAALSKGAVVEAGAKQGVQRQPITFVEATPLSESRAEEIRRKRQDEEMRTEAKIVEKLEKSRMEDERRRAELLFGDRLNQNPQPQNQNPPEPVVIERAPVVVEPTPVVAEPLSLEETETTVESRTLVEEEPVLGFFDSSYIGINAGVPAYPEFQEEIVGNYNVGLKFGMGHERFMFEVGLGMAQFYLENQPYLGSNGLVASNSFAVGLAGSGGPLGSPADFEMKQYMGSIGSRYQLLDGFVRPNVGGEIIYSYRQYSSLEQTVETNNVGQAVYLPSGTAYGNSHAVDFGLLAGVDLMVSPQFYLGADLKYLFNVGYRLEGDRGTAGTTFEKLQHLVGGLSARFQF